VVVVVLPLVVVEVVVERPAQEQAFEPVVVPLEVTRVAFTLVELP
jgi:hypothetical protein